VVEVGPRKLATGFLVGIGLLSPTGIARAISADVLTISAGASYTGSSVEVTVPEANESPALTLTLSSPLAASPQDVTLIESPEVPPTTEGFHTIHVAPGTGANEVDVDFGWNVLSQQAIAEICSTTVGFASPGFCFGETAESQDLTDLIFPSSAFPNGAPFHVVFQSDAAPVPEPGSLGLVATGIAGFLLLQRRPSRHPSD